MKDKFFVDSNIVVYALGDLADKKTISQDLLAREPILSTQVLTEVTNVCLKKLGLKHDLVSEWLGLLIAQTHILTVSPEMIQHALVIAKKHQYSFYDSLIIATAIHAGASILYTEDLHHQQKIETIRIVNPFR